MAKKWYVVQIIVFVPYVFKKELRAIFFVLPLQASRAQILKKAAEYIQFMRKKNNSHQQDIEDLKRQNSLLESQSECASFNCTLITLILTVSSCFSSYVRKGEGDWKLSSGIA